MNFVSLALAAAAAAAPVISAERIREDVRVVASDEFEGRGPGEAGDRKTVDYLSKAFAAAGLEPGGVDGLWTQPVPLVRLDRQSDAKLSLAIGSEVIPLAPGEKVTLALRNVGRTEVANAPLVFGGYGVSDPARGWDAYEGVDLRGKVVVVLANDPDFEADRDLGFEGRRMVLAGRIGSKFEAAARAGALGVLVIHEDAAASYPFLQVASGDALPAFVLAPLKPSTLQLSGWLRIDVAGDLLTRAGLELESLKRQSRSPSFRAFAIKEATLSVSGELKATEVVSHNVLARITGASAPGEYVLYGAHWDANGRNGPDAKGDWIRNGAVDNATGTAEVLEIARAFAQGPRPGRTVVFAAWTAEEKGLLGAEHYAANPIYPLAKTVAVINLDPHVVLPAARDVELIGGGRTDLEARLAEAAATLGLRVTPEPSPEAGWYFRSDHFPFAKKGVPAIAFRAGRDLVDGGTAAGNALVERYNAHDYHQTTDAFDPRWTFAGTVQEATVAYELGRAVANGASWPSWNPGVEYGTVRAASATLAAASTATSAQAGDTGPRAKAQRLEQRIHALGRFGANPGGGVSRVAFSDADIAGREYITSLMRGAGLEVRIDAAGNIIGRRAGTDPALPVIMTGSHIDSVPQGGNYDGDVGVLGAIEVAELLREHGIATRHPFEFVVFTDEEGGVVGSQAMAGRVGPKTLDVVSHSGLTIRDGIRTVGGDPLRLAEARRAPGTIAAFVELHIEQGAILDETDIDIGVVEGIVGIRWWDVTVEGTANHAGTTPMNRRRDALLAASELALAVNRIASTMPGTQVATVGRISAEPGAPNVIPGRVEMSLEIRDLAAEKMESVFRAVETEAKRIAGARGTPITFSEIDVALAPAPTDERLRKVIEAAAASLRLSHRRLPSGAGHDAQDMAHVAPMAMIFVPSQDGISHAPQEYTAPADIANGVDVLLRALLAIDRGLPRP